MLTTAAGCIRPDRPVRGVWVGAASVTGAPPTRVSIAGAASCLLLRHRQSDLQLRLAGTSPSGSLEARLLNPERSEAPLLRKVALSAAPGPFEAELTLTRAELGEARWIALSFDRAGVTLETLELLEDAPSTRLIVLGLDGLSWRILDPLLKAGRLPNFQALLAAGTAGELLSVRPMLSPVVWTTIASGHQAKDHGISGFVDAERRLVNATQVRRKRLWELLTERTDATLGVVGWFVTWPVERIAGYMLSDRAKPLKLSGQERPQAFHPPLLQGPFESVDRERQQHYFAESRRFTSLPLDPEWRAKLAPGTPERERMELLERRFLRAYLRDSTYVEAGLSFYESLAPDVFFLYLRGADHAQHAYWFERAPDESRIPVSAEDRRYFAGLIDSYYVYLDEVLGRIRRAAPPGASLMLVSDHGFRSFERTRQGRPDSVAYHERAGVYVAAGPRFKRGLRGATLSALDLCPLWLHLFGLPAASDMPGRIPEEILTPGAPPLPRLASYGLRDGAAASRSSEADEELLEQFKALGYIGE